jgi:hypothetical protein
MTVLNGVPDGLQERHADDGGGRRQAEQEDEAKTFDFDACPTLVAIVEKICAKQEAYQYQADDSNKAKNDRAIRRYTFWLTFFTAALVAVTTISTVFLYRTDTSVRKTLILGQRAFVHLENITISAAPYWTAEPHVSGNVIVHEAPENKGQYLRTVFS